MMTRNEAMQIASKAFLTQTVSGSKRDSKRRLFPHLAETIEHAAAWIRMKERQRRVQHRARHAVVHARPCPARNLKEQKAPKNSDEQNTPCERRVHGLVPTHSPVRLKIHASRHDAHRLNLPQNLRLEQQSRCSQIKWQGYDPSLKLQE